MSEPRKEDVERALLGAARGESPSPRARAAALAAATAAMTVAAATAGTAAAGAGGKSATGFFAAWKPMLVGALLGGVVVGLIVDYAHRSRAALGTEVVNVAATAAEPKTNITAMRANDKPLEHGENVAPSVSVNDLPPAAAPARSAVPTPSAKPSATPATSASIAASAPPATTNVSSSLRDEVRLLDRAREAIVSREASTALDVLDEYDRTFASPALKPEAQVLRVEALLAKGDREGALLVARSLVVSHPSGPHRDRLRRLLGGDAP